MDSFININDFEEEAKKYLSKNAYGYFSTGAMEEISLLRNKNAFKKIMLLPRVLIDVSIVDLKCQVLGINVSIPIGIAPTGMQKLAHEDGEIANAKAAGRVGTIFILSSLGNTSLENVAKAAPNTIKWFQLYVFRNRSVTENLVKRAESAGYKALVLTVDAPVCGIRWADLRNKFSMPPHLGFENFTGVARTHGEVKDGSSGINQYVTSLFDNSVTWKDIAWLKRITSMPIILKGILSPEDAYLAKKYDVNGIIVSNHGARQLDTVPSSIEVLPSIVKAVEGSNIQVYLDGGVRTGNDVFKAIALGAKMVFVGRPAVWGLTVGGEEGVFKVLDILKNEFQNTMALAGCRSIEEINSNYIYKTSINKL